MNFSCIDIDGENRNKDDLEILCSTSEHTLWELFVALPAIIVWGIGIPFFALALLTKLRKKLDTFEAR